MLELDGEYNPHKNSMHDNRVVFVRIEADWLNVSYPIGQHGITKRRLWSDSSKQSSDITFGRHLIYNLIGSHVYLAPLQLAQRRAWNKKYPIAIRLSKDSKVSILTPPGDLTARRDVLASEKTKRRKTTSPTENDSIQSAPGRISLHGRSGNESCRKGVGGKILYLFTRTDREKDEW